MICNAERVGFSGDGNSDQVLGLCAGSQALATEAAPPSRRSNHRQKHCGRRTSTGEEAREAGVKALELKIAGLEGKSLLEHVVLLVVGLFMIRWTV